MSSSHEPQSLPKYLCLERIGGLWRSLVIGRTKMNDSTNTKSCLHRRPTVNPLLNIMSDLLQEVRLANPPFFANHLFRFKFLARLRHRRIAKTFLLSNASLQTAEQPFIYSFDSWNLTIVVAPEIFVIPSHPDRRPETSSLTLLGLLASIFAR
ncbi:hypothetical protein SISSUDRAFT_568933 [Sistotremastrum suecicum HHB10207 ss-3]|uniref:Uncharacterized protein n=1 Tax=Sistotremastrum suecicum HHB10207 ss-3 TaxID=1314776 RepID=A0A165XHX7_9AGAM|nr:hypothetical protein SISSUDRAFT_568933 [Sistotremastrum suecicum HHB10207 ss-3]